MPYYLGIDAGGTHTRCVLADDSRKLALAESVTIKLLRTTPEQAEWTLDQLLREVAAQAGIPLDAITRTCVGLSGASIPRLLNWTREALTARVSGEIILFEDVEIALDAAFHGGPGLLILAGTGSNILGRSSDGTRIRVGGWGPICDEGSGLWIGREAVRAVFFSQDSGTRTLLTEAILTAAEITGPALSISERVGQLIAWANTTPPPDFPRLTHLVVESAAAGDNVAARILLRAGHDLASQASLAHQRLRAYESSRILPAIAFAGGILTHVAPVRDAMIQSLRRELPGIRIHPDAVDPLDGALWHARGAIPVSPPESAA